MVRQHFDIDLGVKLFLQNLRGDELKDRAYFDFVGEDVFVFQVLG